MATRRAREEARSARRQARNHFRQCRREFEGSRWRLQVNPYVFPDPEDGHPILGQNFPDERKIVLHAHTAQDGRIESTFLHELLHCFFTGETRSAEGEVGQMERDTFRFLIPQEVRWLTKTILTNGQIVLHMPRRVE